MLSLSHALVVLLAGTGLGPLCAHAEKAAAAVETPQPAQPGMVPNCQTFYLVRPGDTCRSVAATYGLSVAQFQRWNTATGPDCNALLADSYACVGVADEPPPSSTTTTTTTTTTPIKTPPPSTAPVETPSPIQPGMVSSCRSFHYVEPGQTCADIQRRYGVSVRDLVRWNPAIGGGCTNMWADTWLCVGVA